MMTTFSIRRLNVVAPCLERKCHLPGPVLALSMNLPLSLPSPPLWAGKRVAEGRERGDPRRFMVPMHGIEVVGALHEPTHPRPLPGGEHACVGALSVPFWERFRPVE